MNKEPLIHITKRTELSTGRAWLIRGIAIIAAMLFCGLITLAVTGLNPIKVYATIFEGSFGSSRRFWVLLSNMSALLGLSLAVTPAFKMRFWNIGAEGQCMVGCLATAACMILLGGKLPNGVLWIVMFIAAVLAGALWGCIPAFFKAKFGTNETLFTLMMNYVAIKLTDSCVNAWKGLNPTLPSFNSDTKIGWMPQIFGQDAALPIFVFLAVAIVMYVYMTKTKQGYDIAVVGESHNTARYAGINVKKVIIRTMIISGAVCGLCGAMTVSGYSHNINSATVANGYGFTAIIVAWLSKFNTIGMIFTSLLIVFLERGTNQLGNAYAAFGTGAGQIMIGLVLFFIIGSEFFINYSVKLRKKQAAAAEEAAK